MPLQARPRPTSRLDPGARLGSRHVSRAYRVRTSATPADGMPAPATGRRLPGWPATQDEHADGGDPHGAGAPRPADEPGARRDLPGRPLRARLHHPPRAGRGHDPLGAVHRPPGQPRHPGLLFARYPDRRRLRRCRPRRARGRSSARPASSATRRRRSSAWGRRSAIASTARCPGVSRTSSRFPA